MSLSELIDKKLKELEEMSSTGAGEAYDTPNAFSKDGEEDEEDNAEVFGYKKVKESKFKKYAKATFLNEVVGSKLLKIERIINHNIKLKTEEGIDNKQYWKSTRGGLYKISERMMRISEKLRRF